MAALLAAVIGVFRLADYLDNSAEVWLTTGDEENLLDEQAEIEFQPDEETPEAPLTVEVDPDTTYQEIEGFGMAVTGSSAYLINNVLTPDQKDDLLDDIFTDDGINMNFIRHSIGASDYSVDENGDPLSYSYNDVEEGGTDYDLENFSIEPDREVWSLLGEIQDKNEDIFIFGSPWSAPPWMKEEYTFNGSFLDYTDPAIYETYADYFVKYIQAYEEEGVEVDAVAVQNEPEYTSEEYPTMSMNGIEQRDFIREHLGPAFEEENIETEIIAFDHNWDTGLDYANAVLGDEQANDYTDGMAFHCYAGEPEAMTDVHEAYPNKNIYVTECSGGSWNTDFGENLSWNMTNMLIGGTRNYAESVQFWNLALDPSDGPQNGGCPDCRGVVTIDPDTGDITENVEYYTLGHASKFVEPGAVRIDSTHYADEIETVAFENPDGSHVLIAANLSAGEQEFKVQEDDESFMYSLPAESAVTFTW
ncbi:glycoside hydrolase family 30 beta sandwich domain-containing protein [Sinobaca sp. H24]|uniref:glycoside hydrolase family 30 protein n=1 Tax=Sinobaca sp. H24 TaxID=2923376 RepID=UPI0020793805|nr:glycoside hydrolase family 30 beta sandwich domain-containing protein [Sinobaca sp. H24]